MFAGEASSDGWDKITIPLAAAVRHTQSKLSYESGAYSGNMYPTTKLSLNGQDLDPSTYFSSLKMVQKADTILAAVLKSMKIQSRISRFVRIW